MDIKNTVQYTDKVSPIRTINLVFGLEFWFDFVNNRREQGVSNITKKYIIMENGMKIWNEQFIAKRKD